MNIPVIDSHLHIWDPKCISYPWLEGNSLLNRAYLPDEYFSSNPAVPIEGMVFVQCECDPVQFMSELEWVASIAAKDNRIRAIIPWAPLEQGEKVRPVLDRMKENRLVKGIRRIIEFEEDQLFCLRPDFIRGVQILAEYGYSFDINIAHHQMPQTIKLVEQCPEVSFILDHAGKPDIRNHVFNSWSENLKRLSEIPQVFCKISGLITEAAWHQWTVDELKPYIEQVVQCFGYDRIVYAGDWPVVLQAGSYTQWFEALAGVTADWQLAEQKKLFHDNAVRFYKLNE